MEKPGSPVPSFRKGKTKALRGEVHDSKARTGESIVIRGSTNAVTENLHLAFMFCCVLKILVLVSLTLSFGSEVWWDDKACCQGWEPQFM